MVSFPLPPAKKRTRRGRRAGKAVYRKLLGAAVLVAKAPPTKPPAALRSPATPPAEGDPHSPAPLTPPIVANINDYPPVGGAPSAAWRSVFRTRALPPFLIYVTNRMLSLFCFFLCVSVTAGGAVGAGEAWNHY